jgi:hypothetical protein
VTSPPTTRTGRRHRRTSNDENLKQEVREAVDDLLAEAEPTDPGKLAA